MVIVDSLAVTGEETPSAWLDAGTVLKAHGVRGELRVAVEVSASVLATVLSVRLVHRDGRAEVFTVVHARRVDRGVLLTLKECPDRDVALKWHGARLQLRRQDVPEPASGEYYVYELQGARVQDGQGLSLGVVRTVVDNGGQALLILESPRGELLLPLVPATVRSFDRGARLLTVVVPEGLWDDVE